MGWVAVRTFVLHDGRSELLSGSHQSGMGGHGESLRRSRDDAAGAEPGAGPADRSAANVGTARGSSVQVSLPGRRGRIGAMPAERAGGTEPP